MKLFTETTSKALVVIGISLFALGIVFFLWNDISYDITKRIDSSKVGQFGDYIGGLIGSLWALAGVILFYVALTDQREDIKTNREVLITQVKALEQQIVEFDLQREEMELTRKVFTEQSKTLKTQQFESTFFNSMNLLNNIIENINYSTSPDITYYGRDSFEYLYQELTGYYQKLKGEYVLRNLQLVYSPSAKFNISDAVYKDLACQSYEEFFDKHQSDLGHYFRTIYNIIKFVSDNKPENPKYYTGLVRAQLSTFEHLLLFYNCFSEYGEEKFQPYVIEFSLLDNMPTSRLLDEEHESFYPTKAYE
jgi:hypothetical protein